MMDAKRIAALKLGTLSTTIRVRIFRKWIPHLEPPYTCYVFLDQFVTIQLIYGDAIQAITQITDRKYAESKLNMLMCYRIEDYVCGPVKRYVNILSHEVNLRIGPLASIIPITDNNHLPKLYFNLHGYERLAPLNGSD
ncbi:hypothetical protein Hanom_Chr06g00497531 [Helianthus anomalus]